MATNYPNEDVNRLIQNSKLDGLVTPKYDGNCISNIPDTIFGLFGLENHRPISDTRVLDFKEETSNVIFLLLDGFGLEAISRELLTDNSSPISRVIGNAPIFSVLTSVFPSTTSTATTTLHTGLTPQEHGVVGYSMFFRQLGVISDTLRFVPFSGGRNSIFQLGVDPQTFVGAKTIHEQLAEEKITSNLYHNKWIVNSGLSEITSKGAQVIPHLTAQDMFVRLKSNLRRQRRGDRSFHFAYYASPDTVAHARGPESEEYTEEVKSIFWSLEEILFRGLDPEVAKNTVLLISSDHGLSQIEKENLIDIQNHPALLDLLAIPPTGDSRCLFLHTRESTRVRQYLEKSFADQFEIISTKHALCLGLFGEGTVRKGFEEKIGDLIAIPRTSIAVDNSLLDPRSDYVPGRHGGLSKSEMLVPFIACKLR